MDDSYLSFFQKTYLRTLLLVTCICLNSYAEKSPHDPKNAKLEFINDFLTKKFPDIAPEDWKTQTLQLDMEDISTLQQGASARKKKTFGKDEEVAVKVSWYDIQQAAFGIQIEFTDEVRAAFLVEEAKNKIKNSSASSCEVTLPGSPAATLSGLSESASAATEKLHDYQSLAHNSDLMFALFEYSNKYHKGLSKEGIEDLVRQGERNAIAIINGDDPQPQSKLEEEMLVISLMWYLQAKSGLKTVFNPESWKYERGLVVGGTYRFKDGEENIIYNYLKKLSGVNKRVSSHYKDESLEQRGFDITESKIPLPGKNNTQTVLFGKLKNGESFLKVEREPFNIAKPVKSIQHLKNWSEHNAKEKSGERDEMFSHRESMHKIFKEKFEEYMKKTEGETKGRGAKKEIRNDYGKGKIGLHQMLTILKQDKYKDVEGQALERVINQFQRNFCVGVERGLDVIEEGMGIARKSCEAIVDLDPRSNPKPKKFLRKGEGTGGGNYGRYRGLPTSI